jgi:NDP-sugar pyrophosphorylase family protein
MNDILVRTETEFGYGFIPQEYLGPGEDEYRMRNRQLGKALESFRQLKPAEIETLIKNGNSSSDWGKIRVREPFDATLIRNSEFAGLVRIGSLERVVLEHHDMTIPAGITNSRIISCDIGDNCAVHSCDYIAHYIIGDRCILLNNDEIHATNHAKWGNGILKDGEPEDVRVWLDLMNEVGGRSVLPFDGMICADAYLWAKRREDADLMERFKVMTQAAFEQRRGEYGTIGAGSVIKSNHIIKDVRIGECAYIKGANKLKNITIKSSDVERTQIGEGVELVNGIVGYGCRVFYGSKAVRFVMGTNSSLKYGARLIHSVLGDNSTVSCCEILNNLIFPAHEQHHNTSFLIAALVKGQSNMAAGATIGSNHNSRANDGEIEAGRGFWPGLSTSIKHSSRFASYCLLSKGHYRFELDVPFPFALLADDVAHDRLIIMPAYWWMYNMYALARNEGKFLSRDKRVNNTQNIEFSPFAPDIAEEVFQALGLIEEAVGQAWLASAAVEPAASYLGRKPEPAASDLGRKPEPAASDLGRKPESAASGLGRKPEQAVSDARTARIKGRELLFGPAEQMEGLEILARGVENSQRPVVLYRARRAYKAYRHLLRYYAIRELILYFSERPDLSFADAADIFAGTRVTEWDNLGGQLVPHDKVQKLLAKVKSGEVGTWEAMHAEYARYWSEYGLDKAQHAWSTLCDLLETAELRSEAFCKELSTFMETTRFIEEQVYLTRLKDYNNPFRKATFSGVDEMRAVSGTPEAASFVKQVRVDMERWRSRSAVLLERFGLAAGL